jgi:hypothetical protein
VRRPYTNGDKPEGKENMRYAKGLFTLLVVSISAAAGLALDDGSSASFGATIDVITTQTRRLPAIPSTTSP